MIDDVMPERITKIPTSSEVARKRALEKLGLTIDWYNARVEELRNSSGEPCCESCGAPEIKKFRGRPKDLVISSDKKLVCQKCANKNYRQAQKAKLNSRDDREGPQSAEQWWTRNRNRLSDAQKLAHESRDTDIVLLVAALKEHMEGEGWGEEDLRETIAEVCAEIQKNGTLVANYVCGGPGWWLDENCRKKMVSYGSANSFFFHYGYFSAIPQDVALNFLAFAERHLGIPTVLYRDHQRIPRILAALDGREYVDRDLEVRCSTPGCQETKLRSRGEILPAQWFCASCTSTRNDLAQAALRRITAEPLTPVAEIAQQAEREADRKRRKIMFGGGHGTIFGEDGRFDG